MADFEGLIRQALARQNADDPAIRERIYQSSRNALARMIASAKAQSPEMINRQREALENSIRRIEAGYVSAQSASRSAPAPDQFSSPEAQTQPPQPQWDATAREPQTLQPQSWQEFVPEPEPHRQAELSPEEAVPAYPRHERDWNQSGVDSVREVPAPKGVNDDQYPGRGFDDFSVDADEVQVHARPRRASRRTFTIAAFVALLLIVGALVYVLFAVVSGGPDDTAPGQTAASSEDTGGATAAAGDYITILSPLDTGSLVVAGRGKAEIVNQSNTDYVRLISLRPQSKLDETANPILLEIEPGVIQQIAGKRVTVEIQAKSGDSGPANFAVGCEVGGEDICGRRRFRIGLQPEATIFPMSVSADLAGDTRAYLTISTDVTNTALVSGEGSAVDILYARLRLSPAQ